MSLEAVLKIKAITSKVKMDIKELSGEAVGAHNVYFKQQ